MKHTLFAYAPGRNPGPGLRLTVTAANKGLAVANARRAGFNVPTVHRANGR